MGGKFPTGSVAHAPLAPAGTRTRIGHRGGRHRGRHGGRLHIRLGSLARDRGCRSLCNGHSRSRHPPDPPRRVDVGVSRGSTNQIARRPEIQIHERESNHRDSRIDELSRPEHSVNLSREPKSARGAPQRPGSSSAPGDEYSRAPTRRVASHNILSSLSRARRPPSGDVSTRGRRARVVSRSRVPLALAAARAPLPVSAGRLIRRDADEERLIGWLGEVPRERARSAAADGSVPLGSNPTPATPARAARRPQPIPQRLRNRRRRPERRELSDAPRAFLYRGFLTPEECEHIIRVGEPHLHRSSVVAGEDDATGEDKGAIDDIRTSYGMFLPRRTTTSPLPSSDGRGFSASDENQEQLQLLRYVHGQQYKDHMDGLVSPTEAGASRPY